MHEDVWTAFTLDEAVSLFRVNPHFHFETLPPNLWIVAIINIHAGVKAMKTLWRSVPNG